MQTGEVGRWAASPGGAIVPTGASPLDVKPSPPPNLHPTRDGSGSAD